MKRNITTKKTKSIELKIDITGKHKYIHIQSKLTSVCSIVKKIYVSTWNLQEAVGSNFFAEENN